MELDKNKLLELYPSYDKVYGPYTRKDERKHVNLYDSKSPKGTKGKMKVISFPKALVETDTGVKLKTNETVDHKNNIKTDDTKENLQVLSRADNARKGALGNKYCLGYKQPEEQKRSGSKNGMAKLTDSEVLKYRKDYENQIISKKEIMKQTQMCDKSVRNLLNGTTYTNIKSEVS